MSATSRGPVIDWMSAIQLGDSISLVFTRVVDHMRLGLVDEDEETQEPVDRAYWEKRAAKDTMNMTDELFAYLQELDPTLQLNYNKHYIGLTRSGRANNFVTFQPKKSWVRMGVRLPKSADVDGKIEAAELDLYGYPRWGRYAIRLTRSDLMSGREVLDEARARRSLISVFRGRLAAKSLLASRRGGT